jgi:hypothetical protein
MHAEAAARRRAPRLHLHAAQGQAMRKMMQMEERGACRSSSRLLRPAFVESSSMLESSWRESNHLLDERCC